MIFVTVGQAMPFDRFIRAMDRWAACNRDEEVFAQIGAGQYEPQHMDFVRMLPMIEFGRIMREAELIVAHAGMGSIIQSAEAGKPIVLLARQAALREHTTDHQVGTAHYWRGRTGVYVADDEAELDGAICTARTSAPLGGRLDTHAPPEFVARLREAIQL